MYCNYQIYSETPEFRTMEHGTLPEHLISGRRALMEHRNTGTTEWNAQRNSHMEQ